MMLGSPPAQSLPISAVLYLLLGWSKHPTRSCVQSLIYFPNFLFFPTGFLIWWVNVRHANRAAKSGGEDLSADTRHSRFQLHCWVVYADSPKTAILWTAVPVLASKEGVCGFSFLFSLCDGTGSSCGCVIGAGWESAHSAQDRRVLSVVRAKSWLVAWGSNVCL